MTTLEREKEDLQKQVDRLRGQSTSELTHLEAKAKQS